MANDRSKTLTELEDDDWGSASYESHLVRAVHELRYKPIGDFSIEDLRIAVGQSVGFRHLVPIAMEVLEEDPLAEGDFYPGDLLCCVLRCDESYWEANPEQRQRVMDIAERALREAASSDDTTDAELETLR